MFQKLHLTIYEVVWLEPSSGQLRGEYWFARILHLLTLDHVLYLLWLLLHRRHGRLSRAVGTANDPRSFPNRTYSFVA